LGNVTWRPEKGHLVPEVRVANEIAWDYVWDKLYPHPISVTCSKGYIRKAPFVLGAQPLDSSPLSHCSLLNKLGSQKLWCPLSLCLNPPATFLEDPCQGFWGWCFHFFVVPGANRPYLLVRREPLSQKAKETSSSCTKEPGKAQESTWDSYSSDW
jgi:hypothetical protein